MNVYGTFYVVIVTEIVVHSILLVRFIQKREIVMIHAKSYSYVPCDASMAVLVYL